MLKVRKSKKHTWAVDVERTRKNEDRALGYKRTVFFFVFSLFGRWLSEKRGVGMAAEALLKIQKNTTNRIEKIVHTMTRAKNRKTKDRLNDSVGKRVFARKKGISFWTYA